MLVLTRRVGEEIVIGDGIRVKIVALHNQRVRLGITAPPEVTVHREEVHLRRQEFIDCATSGEMLGQALGSL
jgi:carbon storage regulator